jgi:hypothetical protein
LTGGGPVDGVAPSSTRPLPSARMATRTTPQLPPRPAGTALARKGCGRRLSERWALSCGSWCGVTWRSETCRGTGTRRCIGSPCPVTCSRHPSATAGFSLRWQSCTPSCHTGHVRARRWPDRSSLRRKTPRSQGRNIYFGGPNSNFGIEKYDALVCRRNLGLCRLQYLCTDGLFEQPILSNLLNLFKLVLRRPFHDTSNYY